MVLGVRGRRRLAALLSLLFVPAGVCVALPTTGHATAEPPPPSCVEPNPPPPGAAFRVRVLGTTSTTAALTWPRPLTCLAGYEVHADGRLVAATRENVARLSGLAPATTYTVTVQAIGLDERVRAVTPPETVTTLP